MKVERYLEIEQQNQLESQRRTRYMQFHALLDYLGVELLQDENGDWRVVKK